MKVIGIVVEYNPFHNGHLYQINKIREMYKDAIIVVAMSGNYTERGEFSVIDKWDKASISLSYGVDAVLEIPYVFSTQSADTFAYASICMLANFGVDTLVFGSESNNLEKLMNAARVQINNDSFDQLVKTYVSQGFNYPTSLSKSIFDLTGENINESNDILAVSYIKEILKNHYNIKVMPLKRTNSFLDLSSDDTIVSAMNIRKRLIENEDVSKYVPSNVLGHFRTIDSNKYFDLLKYKIISEKTFLNKYHLVEEGLSNRIYKAVLKSNNMEELINNIKSKRYTVLRINRILLNIFTGFTKEEAKKYKVLEYIRILGLSKEGRKYYKSIKDNINVPVINKFSKYDMLQTELKVTILYSIIVNDSELVKDEIKKHAVII